MRQNPPTSRTFALLLSFRLRQLSRLPPCLANRVAETIAAEMQEQDRENLQQQQQQQEKIHLVPSALFDLLPQTLAATGLPPRGHGRGQGRH